MMFLTLRRSAALLAILCPLPGVMTAVPARAQQPATTPVPTQADSTDAPPPVVTVFQHPDTTRYLVSGQANIILQGHPGFHADYSGPNSLLDRGEYKVSLVGTLFLGYQLIKQPRYALDAIYDEESSGGRGVSEALGLAGFTNLDVVRNPTLGSVPYTARVQLRQTIGLTDKTTTAQRTAFSLPTAVPTRRFELRVGKMSLPDSFDQNTPGSDSHLQFLNWTVDNNGAWDYAADTRGYTYAAVAELDWDSWTARYGVALMPTEANGVDLDWNLRRARGENYELDWNHSFLPNRKGAYRVIGFVNHANMGVYRQQNLAAIAGHYTPDITAHTPGTTVKYGTGFNFEQELTADLRAFGRFGWNEGAHQSFAYTEVDQTFELGADLAGTHWHRPSDKLGLVGVSNAIKRDHQHYLQLGGQGFLLGDGNLSYGREDILEFYYTAHNWRGLFTSLDTQFIAHPGYNTARGPVAMLSLRTHVDF